MLFVLTQVEESLSLLEDKLSTAQAIERSLCDRIRMLEAQLSENTVYPRYAIVI